MGREVEKRGEVDNKLHISPFVNLPLLKESVFPLGLGLMGWFQVTSLQC
jgi:hypothetical protein